MTTVIVSDIHLGSRNSQAHLLSRLLQTNFDRLILNGDTINNLNFKKFKPKHWTLFGHLREIARHRELILIRGNHDVPAAAEQPFGPGEVLANLLGVNLHEEYQLEIDYRKYLVLHGDRFDPTLHWPVLTDTADWCYQATQKINKKAAKWLKQRAKKLGGVIQFVKNKSAAYARSKGCDGIVTGHTHFCDDDRVGEVHYVNTGCWVDKPCTYVLADQNKIKLCTFDDALFAEELLQPRIVYAS